MVAFDGVKSARLLVRVCGSYVKRFDKKDDQHVIQ